MSLPLEEKAVSLINNIFDDPKFPWNKLKSMTVCWELVGGSFWLPVFKTQFYETEKEKQRERQTIQDSVEATEAESH
jgi:hypothetical protein